MFNEPSAQVLNALPRLYTDEDTPTEDKIIHLHFFIGGCHWYATEFDGDDLFFGFANLNDPEMAEWGYFSLVELKTIRVNGSTPVTLIENGEPYITAMSTVTYTIEGDASQDSAQLLQLQPGQQQVLIHWLITPASSV